MEIVDLAGYVKKKIWQIRDLECPFSRSCNKREQYEDIKFKL